MLTKLLAQGRGRPSRFQRKVQSEELKEKMSIIYLFTTIGYLSSERVGHSTGVSGCDMSSFWAHHVCTKSSFTLLAGCQGMNCKEGMDDER